MRAEPNQALSLGILCIVAAHCIISVLVLGQGMHDCACRHDWLLEG
jgi:hypothetical protein